MRSARNAAVDVRIHPEQGDPRTLVEMAKEEARKAREQARREKDEFAAFNEVWVVFDRDVHERFHEACDMARGNRIETALSNPCFELWLLLHFRDSPGARHRRDVQKMLRTYLPGYDKHLDYQQVAGRVAQASERARRLVRDAEEMDEPLRNPTTRVYRLLESIARDSLR